MKAIILLCCTIFCISFAGPPAYAKIYQWIDKNGVKHFSESPPDYEEESPPEDDTAVSHGMSSPAVEIDHSASLKAVSRLSYLGTEDSLKSIQQAAMPAAHAGNRIAIHICRQTMHGLDDDAGLRKMRLEAAIQMGPEVVNAWTELVKNKADNGDPFFKVVLAILYTEGDGVAKNPKNALGLYQKAASGGYDDALIKLGHIYHQGLLGTDVDFGRALSYYREAAEQGRSSASFYIGIMYYNGRGVPQDRTLAFEYFLKAAKLGYAPAQNEVGRCYYDADGVTRDTAEGTRWLKAAARSGNFNAINSLLRMAAADRVSAKDLEDVNLSAGRSAAAGYKQDIPRGFINVEICSLCLEEFFQTIRLCEIESVDRRLNADKNLLNSNSNAGWTPLTMAIASGCTNMTAYLIDKGADINQRHAEYNFTPLHIAAHTGQTRIVEMLIRNGANLNALCNPPSRYYWYGRLVGTPLHTALFNNKYAVLEILLKNGADYNTRDQDGKTLFEFAVDYNLREKLAKIYNKVGIPVPDAPATVEELNEAIHDCSATSTRNEGQKRVRELLRADKELIHQKDKYGITPLHNAAFYHLADIARLLVENGADLNAKDQKGRTPLYSISHDAQIAQYLIDHGARVNEQDNSGQTPLHIIAERARFQSGIDVAKVLLANGASKSIRDSYGRTPYDIARQKGYLQVAEILR